MRMSLHAVHATTIIGGPRIALVDCTTFIARLLVVGRPQLIQPQRDTQGAPMWRHL